MKQRRLLGAARPRHRHLRPADQAADAVPRQRHPGQPHRPGGAALPEPLPDAVGAWAGQQLHHHREPRADVGHLRRPARPPLHRQPQHLRALLGQRRRDARARRVRPGQRHRLGRFGGRLRRPVDGRRLGPARQLPGDHPADAALRGQGRQAVLQHRVAARDLRPERRHRLRAAGRQRRRPHVGPAQLHGGRLHHARRPALRADPAQERHLAGPGLADQRPRRAQPAGRRRASSGGRWRPSRATTARALRLHRGADQQRRRRRRRRGGGVPARLPVPGVARAPGRRHRRSRPGSRASSSRTTGGPPTG